MDDHSWIHLCLLEQIWLTEPQFHQYPWGNFRDNFNRLADKADQQKESIAFDEMALQRYQSLHPRNATTNRGLPFWDGSPTQLFLRQDVEKQGQDIKNGLIPRAKLPAEMHATRPAYKEYDLKTFRNHYYREKRYLIETVYWQKKRNRDGQKKNIEREQSQMDA